MSSDNSNNLKDYSKDTIINAKLYKQVQKINPISLSTSVCEVVGDSKVTEQILLIEKGNNKNEVIITTFGFVGRFTYFGVEFNITYRFGKILLSRMISKVNNFPIESLELEDRANHKKNKKEDNLALLILYMNFIFKLEKLAIIGLPKVYKKIEHHDAKFKGQIDINRFIKKDIPFQGKISSNSYEQEYIQEIVDVLYSALSIVENSMSEVVNQRMFQIRNLLNHYANKVFVDERTIQNAILHKSIQNSLYSDFKGILEISSSIINHNPNLVSQKNKLSKGVIFDISLLWESYLYELLRENCEDEHWKVIHEEECKVYKDMFFNRGMKPDIIIKNEKLKKIIVLDAKSKSMKFEKGGGDGAWGDLDRSDFFQINTYMTYYDKQGYEVLAGGLLYPIKKEFDCRFNDENCEEDYEKLKAHSDNWFGNSKTKFIVDGIDLSKDNLLESEKNFITRIKKLVRMQNDPK